MNILVINPGSSSIKFGVFDMNAGKQVFKDEIIRKAEIEQDLQLIPQALEKAQLKNIDAIGQRVVHGGSQFHSGAIIDDKVKKAITDTIDLAPLHNPLSLAAISMVDKIWPNLPQVAIFDTAFHQTIPDRASTYAVPEEWRQAGLKRYGFHGTSHKYVMQRVAEELSVPAADLRIISCHLGNGASVCAIDRGVSVDNSMGMTVLEGLVMGTRSGDVDPGIFSYLKQNLGLSLEQIEETLYDKSGLLALSGVSNDMHLIEEKAASGDKKAQLAINIYAYRVRKYIGAYAAAMSGFDILAFTGGIGENSASMRKRICSGLEFLGLYFDDDKNQDVQLENFSAPQLQQLNSRIKVLVTKTREQFMIAKETHELLTSQQFKPHKDFATIPVAVSAHHIHLTQESVEKLFGAGYQLKPMRPLHQSKEWASYDQVDVVGPRGTLKKVRILGPCRVANQIEICQTEAFQLGVDAPIRLSGDVAGTPKVTLIGPAGSLTTEGVIIPRRHIHMNPTEAEELGLKNGDIVEVEILAGPGNVIFGDVVVRVKPSYNLEMHLNTDEGNAANISHGGQGEIVPIPQLLRINSKLR